MHLSSTCQVVLLAGQGTWYEAPILPKTWLPREHFGLHPEWTLYGCLQMLAKLHPSFYLVLRDILLRNPSGHLVLVADANSHATSTFMRRLKRCMTSHVDEPWRDAAEKLSEALEVDPDGPEFELEGNDADGAESLWSRVHLLPRQSKPDALRLLREIDVVLQPFPFDGSRTSSEALGLARPTVSMPRRQVRG